MLTTIFIVVRVSLVRRSCPKTFAPTRPSRRTHTRHYLTRHGPQWWLLFLIAQFEDLWTSRTTCSNNWSWKCLLAQTSKPIRKMFCFFFFCCSCQSLAKRLKWAIKPFLDSVVENMRYQLDIGYLLIFSRGLYNRWRTTARQPNKSLLFLHLCGDSRKCGPTFVFVGVLLYAGNRKAKEEKKKKVKLNVLFLNVRIAWSDLKFEYVGHAMFAGSPCHLQRPPFLSEKKMNLQLKYEYRLHFIE